MPYSGTLLDDKAIAFFNFIAPEVESVLDVGVGAGKYGKIWHSIKPGIVSGVEAYAPYFEQFMLDYKAYYKDVFLADIAGALDSPEVSFDLVIFGDVLEHLPKSIGLDVLHFFIYRSKYVWAQFPKHYRQNPSDVQGNFYEAHVSVWKPNDFDTLDTHYSVWWKPPLYAVAAQGYIPAKGFEEWALQNH